MKKILSTILAFVMLVSCFAFTGTAEQEENGKTGADYSKYISFFYSLNIFGAEYSQDSTLTRADYAQILTRLLIKDGSLDSYRGEIYKDVPVEYDTNKEINYMNLRGILNGKSYDMFYPKDTLTLNEACAGIVRTLGYTSKADSVGFLRTATDLGALKGVTSDENGCITAGSLAKMLFNVLEVPFVESYIHNGVKEENIGSTTLFDDYLELKKGYGMVTGVDGLYLNDSFEDLDYGQVLLGNEVFTKGSVELEDYFGVYIDYYYKKDDTMTYPEVLAVISKDKTEEITVNGDDINNASSSSVTYYNEESDKNVTLKIATGAVVLYNGKNVVAMDKKYIPKNGSVRLISSDSKNYNIVIIYDYQSFVVQSSSKGKISFKYGAKYIDDDNVSHSSLDFNDNNLTFIVKKDGKTIQTDEIVKDNVVSVASSQNRYYIEVSDTALKGVIRGSKDNPESYMLFGKYYEVDPGYAKMMNDGTSDVEELKIGLNTTFYIDFMGKITGTDDDMSGYTYAYLYGVLKKGAFSDALQVKVFAEGATEFEVYNISENCTLNGSKANYETIYSDLQSLITSCESKTAYYTAEENASKVGQLKNYLPPVIKYKMNGDDIISLTTKTYEVVAANELPSGERLSRTTPVSDNYILVSGAFASRIWQGSFGYFTSYQSDIGSVFANYVPGLTIPVNKAEEDFEAGYATDLLGTSSNTGKNVIIYDMDFTNNTPSLVTYIITETGSNTSIQKALCGVESVSKGDECAYITIYDKNGEKTKLQTNSDDTVINTALSLQKGDIIQYNTDAKGKVGTICKRFSYQKPEGWTKKIYTTSQITNGVRSLYEQAKDGRYIMFSEFLKYTTTVSGKIAVFSVVDSGRGTGSVDGNPYHQSSGYGTGMNQVIRMDSKFLIYDGKEYYSGTVEDLAEGDLVFGLPYVCDLDNLVAFKYDDSTNGGYTSDDYFSAGQ